KEIALLGEYKLQGYVCRVLDSLNKIRRLIPKEEVPEIRFCKICGYPTVTDICKYCRLKMKFTKRDFNGK
ncbi:MAG: hypothetical protein DRN30_04185, partial [Thermoplasmata archaeon]